MKAMIESCEWPDSKLVRPSESNIFPILDSVQIDGYILDTLDIACSRGISHSFKRSIKAIDQPRLLLYTNTF
jgi:hypothetical protein